MTPSAFCCDKMRLFATRECPEHPNRLDCPDTVVHRWKSFTGLVIHDGGGSGYKIDFCPWCGTAVEDVP